MRQGDKVGILKVTKPTSSTLAGYLTSTVQDTSGWSGDHDGNKVNQGYMALSSTASTTITTCDTKYPDLWANAPTAWRSGSSLIIPAQTNGNKVFSAYIDTDGSILSEVGDFIGSVSLNSNRYDMSFNSGVFTNTPNINITAKAQAANDRFAWIRDVSNTFCYYYVSDDAGTTVTDSRSMITIQSVDEDSTPVISLQNNIAGSSIGLPAATATQAGTVKKNKVQRKNLISNISTTTTDITSLKFNNLVVGKFYRVSWNAQVYMSSGGIANDTFKVINGSDLSVQDWRLNPSSANDRVTHSGTVVFEATATTVVFSWTIVSGSLILQGAYANSCWSEIEELDNYEETTDFT